MNFYASPEFLQVLADTYFPGRYARIANVAIGDEILRLLIVDDHRLVTDVPFLDYHVPLVAADTGVAERWDAYAPRVMRRAIVSEDRHAVLPGLDLSPYIDWSMFASYADYGAFIKARHAGTLREQRRLRRRLEERHGPLEFCADDRRGDILALALKWKSKQFRETGITDLFADPSHVRFFDNLLERNLLVASSLRCDGRLLSVWLGFVHDAVRSGWIFTHDHDAAFSRYSIGHQLLQSMLPHSFASEHREFDFSLGAQEYKWLYATHARVLGPLGRPRRSARDVARNALERVRLLGPARALKRAVQRVTGR
jgi:CelD/BcsL family acetyltransferase involved in cellulose biosynthesis